MLCVLIGLFSLTVQSRLYQTSGWLSFTRRFLYETQTHTGYVSLTAAPSLDRRYGWFWTYPMMSILLQGLEKTPVKSVLYVPSVTWQPFGPLERERARRLALLLGVSVDPEGLSDANQPRQAKKAVVPAPLKEFVQELSSSAPVHTLRVNEQVTLPVTVKNSGTEIWPATADPTGKYVVHLSYHWLANAGTVVVRDGVRTELPQDLAPGEAVALAATLQAPAEAGEYVLRLTMVQEQVAWFENQGGQPLDMPVTVTAATGE
jgi:hypothetical protein